MGGLLFALLLAAGLSKAIADALAHGSTRLTALGPWWDQRTSWTLKYVNYYGGDKRPRFIGSKTWLVFVTDAWHFFNAVQWACADAAFLVAAWPAYRWWAVAAIIARRIAFEPCYRWLRK